jgi:hypothetical protein
MSTINYIGLTGVKRSVTGITLTTATVDTLITAIATDEGLAVDYYAWSLLSDPSKNSITYGDSSTKLSAMGLVDGSTVLCTPNQNENKQERQLRKLKIAEAKRKAFGDTTAPYYRVANTLDITLLPDTYNGNIPGADDNPNTGGMVDGRPWTANVSIRALLSGTGQTAYDAASSDAFFAVSQTDYDAVVAGVASVSTVGPTNAEFASGPGSPFSAAYIVTYPVAAATVPASNYILGFRATTSYANQQWRIYGGPTFKSTSPVYSQISTTSPSTGAGAPGIGTFYYLRKAPAVQAATTYIGIYGTQSLTMTAAGTFTGGGYTNGPFTSWSNWTTNMPKVQVIITPTAVV